MNINKKEINTEISTEEYIINKKINGNIYKQSKLKQ